VRPHTHCTYFTVLSFVINPKVNVQRGFSMCPHCESTLLCSIQPLPVLSLTPFSHPPFFTSFQYISLYLLPLHLMLCDMTGALLFCFLFPPSPGSIECFHYYKHILHMSVYVYLLDLSSTSESKQVSFIFLNLAYFT
jgi:hypothetical protein